MARTVRSAGGSPMSALNWIRLTRTRHRLPLTADHVSDPRPAAYHTRAAAFGRNHHSVPAMSAPCPTGVSLRSIGVSNGSSCGVTFWHEPMACPSRRARLAPEQSGRGARRLAGPRPVPREVRVSADLTPYVSAWQQTTQALADLCASLAGAEW